MISCTTGNILDSSADAIVNTVNCEGYMGKGIAYQFKLKYPKNNLEYEKQCRVGNFNIGSILAFNEFSCSFIKERFKPNVPAKVIATHKIPGATSNI